MPSVLSHILNSLASVLSVPVALIQELNLFIRSHLGLYGQLAFDLILLYLVFLLVYKVSRVVLDTALYVILPSVALSLVSSFFLPVAFGYLLPVCVAALIVVNIVRS
jgi:hypothetical protein